MYQDYSTKVLGNYISAYNSVSGITQVLLERFSDKSNETKGSAWKLSLI